MWGKIADIVGVGSGALKSIENIAKEWIETEKDHAEAKALMLKVLDPNGKMRRDISRKVLTLYSWYLGTTLAMLAVKFVCAVIAPSETVQAAADSTTADLTALFTPITTMVGMIVGASFGVNYGNTKKGV